MRVAFYVEKAESDWSYGRLFLEWAKILNFDIIDQISHLNDDYQFIISDDTLSIRISKEIPSIRNKILPYAQTLFGLNMLRKGKKGLIRRAGSLFPFYLTSTWYVKEMRSFDIILSNSIGTSSLLHHLYNLYSDYIAYPGINNNVFKPLSSKKNQVLIYSSAPYLPEIFDPIDVQATKNFISVAKTLGYEVHSFGRKLPFDTDIIQHINIGRDDLIKLYSSSVVTFTPQPVELFGLVPVESMFCGTPVISTYFHEAIDVDANGYVYNSKKLDKIIEKVSSFKKNEVIQSVERFSLTKSSQNLIRILNELIKLQ